MVTDLDEVFRLGTANAAENIAFRRHLHDRHVPETAFQILASEIQKQMDCSSCANCCRHSVVSLGKAEIESIASRLGMTPEAATRAHTDPDPDAPGRRILKSSRAGCVFLSGNLCRIYDARPQACRDFPHVAAGSHSLGARPASLARWAALCPIIFNALETYKRATGYHWRGAR